MHTTNQAHHQPSTLQLFHSPSLPSLTLHVKNRAAWRWAWWRWPAASSV